MYVFCYKYDPTCEKYLSKTFADPRGCRGVAQTRDRTRDL